MLVVGAWNGRGRLRKVSGMIRNEVVGEHRKSVRSEMVVGFILMGRDDCG